jgi:hypothetical protein
MADEGGLRRLKPARPWVDCGSRRAGKVYYSVIARSPRAKPEDRLRDLPPPKRSRLGFAQAGAAIQGRYTTLQ